MVFFPVGRLSDLALCLMVGGSLPYYPSAFLHESHQGATPAFLANTRVSTSGTAVGVVQSKMISSTFDLRSPAAVSISTCRERTSPPFPTVRIGRPSKARRTLSCSAEGGDDVEGDGENEGGIYVPTENLLNDPSYIERILKSMAELAPPVPSLEEVVFKKAVVRFRVENAKCVFLEGAGMRLELIEVPASMKPPDKATDLAADMRSTGLNHIAFDVGPAIEAEGLDGLRGFLSQLNRESEDTFGLSVRMVVSPYEQRIGQGVYDLAFIMDADGIILELLHLKETLVVEMPQAW